MPKKKPQVTLANYGRYTTWNKKSREMPRLLEYTDVIEAIEGSEFGIIIEVDFAKGKILEFTIKHPPIKDEEENLLPHFKGELFVNSIHTKFFVGDGIWLPVDDKIGLWEVIIYLDNTIVISKKFKIVPSSVQVKI